MTKSANRWMLAAASVMALGMGACQKTPSASDAANTADASAATATDAANTADASATTANAAATDANATAPDSGASNTAPSQ
jgi:hypothetical protein